MWIWKNFRISMWVWMRESQDSNLKMTIWITLASTKNHMFLLGSDRNNVDVVMATNVEPQLNHNFGWAILRWFDSVAPCLVICVSNRLKWHQSGWTFTDTTTSWNLLWGPPTYEWCQDLLGGEQEDPARTSFRSCHGWGWASRSASRSASDRMEPGTIRPLDLAHAGSSTNQANYRGRELGKRLENAEGFLSDCLPAESCQWCLCRTGFPKAKAGCAAQD